MGYYNLYLDESAIKNGDTKVYCVAGVIVNRDKLSDFRKSLARLKYSIWNDNDEFGTSTPKDRILHEAQIRSGNKSTIEKYPYYKVFRIHKNVRTAIKGVGKIIESNNLDILGCIVDETSIENEYNCKQNHYTSYWKCLNNIITNFNLFLIKHKSKGSIILESRRSGSNNLLDIRTKKMFYKILSRGTCVYSAQDLQKNIQKINFIGKHENDAGLQVADFIPRPLLLNYCGIKQSKPSIYQTIRKHRYSNNRQEQEFNAYQKYGVTILK